MSVNGYSYKVKMVKEKLGKKPYYNYESNQFSAFDIPGIIENLKKEQNWTRGELNFAILLKSLSVQVLLTIVHGGTEIVSYQSNDSATYQVLKGSLILHIKNESIVLREGELLTIDEKIKYSFNSIEETAFLLTLVSEKENAR